MSISKGENVPEKRKRKREEDLADLPVRKKRKISKNENEKNILNYLTFILDFGGPSHCVAAFLNSNDNLFFSCNEFHNHFSKKTHQYLIKETGTVQFMTQMLSYFSKIAKKETPKTEEFFDLFCSLCLRKIKSLKKGALMLKDEQIGVISKIALDQKSAKQLRKNYHSILKEIRDKVGFEVTETSNIAFAMEEFGLLLTLFQKIQKFLIQNPESSLSRALAGRKKNDITTYEYNQLPYSAVELMHRRDIEAGWMFVATGLKEENEVVHAEAVLIDLLIMTRFFQERQGDQVFISCSRKPCRDCRDLIDLCNQQQKISSCIQSETLVMNTNTHDLKYSWGLPLCLEKPEDIFDDFLSNCMRSYAGFYFDDNGKDIGVSDFSDLKKIATENEKVFVYMPFQKGQFCDLMLQSEAGKAIVKTHSKKRRNEKGHVPLCHLSISSSDTSNENIDLLGFNKNAFNEAKNRLYVYQRNDIEIILDYLRQKMLGVTFVNVLNKETLAPWLNAYKEEKLEKEAILGLYESIHVNKTKQYVTFSIKVADESFICEYFAPTVDISFDFRESIYKKLGVIPQNKAIPNILIQDADLNLLALDYLETPAGGEVEEEAYEAKVAGLRKKFADIYSRQVFNQPIDDAVTIMDEGIGCLSLGVAESLKNILMYQEGLEEDFIIEVYRSNQLEFLKNIFLPSLQREETLANILFDFDEKKINLKPKAVNLLKEWANKSQDIFMVEFQDHDIPRSKTVGFFC